MTQSTPVKLRVEAVVAMSAIDHAIGKGNALPWKLPADMARFKAITTGGIIIMGTKTALAIGRKLPNRLNLILTRSGKVPFEGQIPVASMDEAIALTTARTASLSPENQVLYVIGGEEVYRTAIPYLTGQHVTLVVDPVMGADAFWPHRDFVARVPVHQWHRQFPEWEYISDNGLETMYMHFHFQPPTQAELDSRRKLNEILELAP